MHRYCIHIRTHRLDYTTKTVLLFETALVMPTPDTTHKHYQLPQCTHWLNTHIRANTSYIHHIVS